MVITAKGFELSDATKEKIQKDLYRKIVRMLPQNSDFQVTIVKKNREYKTDITICYIKSYIRGEATDKNTDVSINLAIDEVKRKLRRLKTKLIDKKRTKGIEELLSSMQSLISDYGTDENVYSDKIKRVKKIEMLMMTDEEAAVQMEMLGHSFFAYINEDGLYTILYDRKDGYGKIVAV